MRVSSLKMLAGVLAAAWLLSACSASRAVEYQVMPGLPVSSPTHITVVYLSPTPRPTSTQVEPTPIAPTVAPPGLLYDDPDYFYGGLIVTLDHVGKIIELKKRQNFLLSLGKEYDWEVTVLPETVISRNLVFTPEPGEQGIYVARGAGKATLRALGEPKCRFLEPSCTRPAVLFTVHIVVE